MNTAAVAPRPADQWLQRYYAGRALFSAAWVALAFAIGRSLSPAAVGLIVAYPLWDCLANYADARRNGGLRANPTQTFNAVVSAAVTLAVIVSVPRGFHAVLGVIGIWATLAGILQLATAVSRWRSADAQWPMILSGAQSALAGVFMLRRAGDASLTLGVADVAPYAAFGAIYFAISAIVLALRSRPTLR
ncbi:DUF308 domain-containing protein [Sphingomonas quercus]|uniref:DUF308 domain-containing protein n=1 Tax=Sphingomonas quercus TaxID=2842451 RepID=A0ABS6BLL6_9SPHN|nr:DUF308 domain-containing protein [Sphingomonas quercus]MBU3079213.1 DUF308 domain-containing protein [Sphingomonas quercus]